MPRYGLRQSDDVSIHIADFQSTYLPGDVIIGHVVTKKAFGRGPRVDQTVVKVSLFGCARTEIVGGPDKTTHLGQAVLVNLEQCIFRGAVSAESRFPFVVTIPKTPQPAVAKTGDSWDKLDQAQRGDRVVGQDMKFLSNTQEDITTHALPAGEYSFKSQSPWLVHPRTLDLQRYSDRVGISRGTRQTLIPLFIEFGVDANPTSQYFISKPREHHQRRAGRHSLSTSSKPNSRAQEQATRERLFRCSSGRSPHQSP